MLKNYILLSPFLPSANIEHSLHIVGNHEFRFFKSNQPPGTSNGTVRHNFKSIQHASSLWAMCIYVAFVNTVISVNVYVVDAGTGRRMGGDDKRTRESIDLAPISRTETRCIKTLLIGRVVSCIDGRIDRASSHFTISMG
jgi:hypothetical protein